MNTCHQQTWCAGAKSIKRVATQQRNIVFSLSDQARTSLENCTPLKSSWGAWSCNLERYLWLHLALQVENRDNGSKQDNRKKRSTAVSLTHFHRCKNITHWRSGWSRYWYLEAILARIGIHTSEQYISKDLLTSQDGGSSGTERLWADWFFRWSCHCYH